MAHNANVNHVRQKLSEPRIRCDLSGKLREGNREEREILAILIQLKCFFINDHAIGIQIHHVLARRFGIHCHEEVDFLPPRDPAIFVRADREPGRQSGNIRREQILPADGNTHLKNGSH